MKKIFNFVIFVRKCYKNAEYLTYLNAFVMIKG
jgi:hypothetical protein